MFKDINGNKIDSGINGMNVKCSGTIVFKNACCIPNMEIADTDEIITDTSKAVLEFESGFTNTNVTDIAITVNLDAAAKQKLISSGKPVLKCPANKSWENYITWSGRGSSPSDGGFDEITSGDYKYYYIRS